MHDHLVSARWACSFTVPATCSHDGIFKDAYQRTNRVNRTKIVRCFPHCCPRHKPRSYCGTTLLLTVSVPPHAHRFMVERGTEICVFARFRTEQTKAIAAGIVIPREKILSSIQSNGHPTAEWITSRLVSRSPTACVFEVNPEARWLYAWDSGATKAQRQTRHVLEAVVIASPLHEPHDFHVLATTQSPTFTFVSFRRAADSEHTHPDQSLLFRALTWELQRRELDDGGRSLHQSAAVHPLERPLAPSPKQLVPIKKPRRPLAHSPDTTTALTRLLAWVGQLPAPRIASLVGFFEHSLRSKHVRSTDVDQVKHSPTRPDAVAMAVQLVWWLHTDDRLHCEAHAHAVRAVGSLGDPGRLQQAYERWIESVASRCERFLVAHGWTWHDICDSLARLGSADGSNHKRHGYDFRSFVAAIRQQAVDSTRLLASPARKLAAVWTCSVSNMRAHHSHRVTSALDVFSSELLMAFWTQLGTVRLDRTLGTPHSLTVTSELHADVSPLGPPRPGMRLVLDRRHRCFATLPHGEPSLGAAATSRYSIGEYIGSVADADTGALVANVTFYAWPRDESAANVYRCRCAFLVPDETSRTLVLRIEMEQASMRVRDARPVGPLETLSLPKKLALVDEWARAWQLCVPYHRT